MTIALDIGAHSVRSLRRQGSRLAGRTTRLAYAVLPDSPRHRRLLEGGGIAFAVCGGRLVLVGQQAVDYARPFREPVRSALSDGLLPRDNPLARQVVAATVEAVLPRALTRDEICCLTVPGGAGSQSREAEFLTRLVRLAGYVPVVVRAGMALVLAELSRTGFTGAGISFGAATCELSIAHRGREIASVAVRRGGDWIDAEFAAQEGCCLWDAAGGRHPDLESIARLKSEHTEPLATASSPRGRLFAALYRSLITELVGHAARALGPVPLLGTLPRPLELVVGGGTAQIPGFAELLDEQLRSAALPVALARARVAAAADYTVARGGLIHAELEAGGAQQAARSAA
ncbi:MAG TPA: hypothetical protein VML55_13755 [Planctomycetaceae bacterium]|nr:hypothetical protein [Planctomycetaceae bacterium]